MSTTLLSVAARWNQPETCGVMSMLGASHSGLVSGNGSGSVTSTAAPARCPDSRAATKSSATTRSPRPPLAKKAPGFIAAKNSGVRQAAGLGCAGHKGCDDVSLGQALGQGIHTVHVLKHNGVDERVALDAADVRTHVAAERGKVAANVARAQHQHIGVFERGDRPQILPAMLALQVLVAGGRRFIMERTMANMCSLTA